MVFQLNSSLDGPTILDSTEVRPNIDGSPDNPDVLVGIEMLSFHVAEHDDIDKNTRVTLRMDIGKDESSTDKRFDAVFWSIAAGLQLYDNVKDAKTESKRPIEIPGGLGKVVFNVIRACFINALSAFSGGSAGLQAREIRVLFEPGFSPGSAVA